MHVKQFAELRRADGAPAISLSTALQTTGDTAGTALLAGSGVGTAIAGRVLRLREGCRLARGREGSGMGRSAFTSGINLAVMLGYGLTGLVVAQFFAAFGRLPSPIWLPAGIALAAALLGRAPVAPGLFAGSVAVNAILFQAPLWVTMAISLTNTIGPLLGARLMRRVAPPDQTFASLRGLAGFIVGGIGLHAAVTGAGGALALLLSGHLSLDHAAAAWARWWLSDAGGVLYLAPTLVLWLVGALLVLWYLGFWLSFMFLKRLT